MSDPDQDSVIEFPCQFPIKAMGNSDDDLGLVVLDIIQRHAPEVTERDVSIRASKNGRYASVTVTITATSKNQLDSIYLELTACEQILMAL